MIQSFISYFQHIYLCHVACFVQPNDVDADMITDAVLLLWNRSRAMLHRHQSPVVNFPKCLARIDNVGKVGSVHLFVFMALYLFLFLDPEGGSQNATLVVVVVVVVVISSLKMPKAFLIRCGVQQNFAQTFLLIFHTDLPSQIFKLVSN